MIPSTRSVVACIGIGWIVAAASSCNDTFEFDRHPDSDASSAAGLDGSSDGDVEPPALCTRDEDCALPNLHCASDGSCVQCTSNGQCSDPTLPYCQPRSHRCVACFDMDDCPYGQVCDRASYHCIPTCRDPRECPVGFNDCDSIRALCIQCRVDADCAGSQGGPVCQASSGRCVACLSDEGCSAPTPYCDVFGGRCAACLSSQECPSTTPTCDPIALECR